MTLPSRPSRCRTHGDPRHRRSCPDCNSAYMRDYQRRRRLRDPARALWERARNRAADKGLPFGLRLSDIAIPVFCPVLDVPLAIGGSRSGASPSLDRVRPDEGYVPGNVRCISDQANKLKSNHNLARLRELAATGRRALRPAYARTLAYVEREALLLEVKRKAMQGGRAGEVWAEIAAFLEKRFNDGRVK